MKIIAGKYKGRNFFMPKDVRPTQNIAREALFDILGQDMTGLVCLELFAGSGAVGLEALSRGAQSVTFVENNPKVAEVIQQNGAILKIEPCEDGFMPMEVLNTDAFMTIKLFARQNKRFDFIFIDPPFERGLAKKALKTLSSYDIFNPECIVVFQHDKKEELPESEEKFFRFKQRAYGASNLSFYLLQENN